jgi:hypothetical protein
MRMGIHYSLRTAGENPADCRNLLVKLRERALNLPLGEVGPIQEWTGSECHYRHASHRGAERGLLKHAETWRDDPRREGHIRVLRPLHVLAFTAWTGLGCDDAHFALCQYPSLQAVPDDHRKHGPQSLPEAQRDWHYACYCETGIAAGSRCGGIRNFLRCHLLVIALLDYALELGILESVDDSGGYWRHRQPAALGRKLGKWDESLAVWSKDLQERLHSEERWTIAEDPEIAPLDPRRKMQGFFSGVC